MARFRNGARQRLGRRQIQAVGPHMHHRDVGVWNEQQYARGTKENLKRIETPFPAGLKGKVGAWGVWCFLCFAAHSSCLVFFFSAPLGHVPDRIGEAKHPPLGVPHIIVVVAVVVFVDVSFPSFSTILGIRCSSGGAARGSSTRFGWAGWWGWFLPGLPLQGSICRRVQRQ